MECKNCELKQRQFYCENCLQSHLRDFRLQTHRFAIDRDEQVQRATKALSHIVEPGRLRRANVAQCQNTVDELMAGLAKLRRENEQKRDRLRTLRETLASRRRTLSAAKFLPNAATPPCPTTGNNNNNNTSGLSPCVQNALQEIHSLSLAIARARSGLVQELVEVFNIVEVGGRPPIGGKSGTKGEWTIGDLILPVPGDIRRYPPQHINAVITHTIHFLSLLAFYLGIKLPFEITWKGGKLGVGEPWIRAGKGGENGGWARWSTKHPLHLSTTPSPTSPTTPPTKPTSTLTSTSRRPSISSPSESGTPTNMVDSHILASPPTQSNTATFTTAFAMLLYNVTYLAHTQNVEVPLSQVGDVLSNLWSVCCSGELGRRSHETKPHLPHPGTTPAFPIEFAQLLQATTANPASRAKFNNREGGGRTGGGGGGGIGRAGSSHKVSNAPSAASSTGVAAALSASSSSSHKKSSGKARSGSVSTGLGDGSNQSGGGGGGGDEEGWDLMEDEDELEYGTFS